MERIRVQQITERQKLTIENGINTYLYIMKHHNEDDEDFRDVYYGYYLTARSSVFAKTKTINKETKEKIANPNWDTYFQLLKRTLGNESLESIVEELKTKLTSNSFEFSFASKLLHTKNPSVPIYDSKIRKYLEEVYKLRFLSESGTKTMSKIKSDWEMLNNWYNNFLKTDEANAWISWFDNEFPKGKEMSKVKKIDTIIFACVN
ncbi:MAG: hypothetical protein E7571_00605 [Ruminococcaceae bacterium]|nr:hypothetical protein [Oscillospiraceae bacterium]